MPCRQSVQQAQNTFGVTDNEITQRDRLTVLDSSWGQTMRGTSQLQSASEVSSPSEDYKEKTETAKNKLT